jgi:rhodanese-related sulfurtransferase
MLRRLMNLPLTVASRAAKAFQEREDAKTREKYGETRDPGEVPVGNESANRDVDAVDVNVGNLTMTAAAVMAAGRSRPIAWVDVRSAEDWKAGHIQGALHMPMSEINVRVSELAWDQLVIAVCNDGRDSSRAVAFFRERGMEDTFALGGGLPAWKPAGGAVVT